MEETDYLQREKEYTIQHFGFDPSILVQEITEESLEYLTSSLETIKKLIKTKKKGKFDEAELDSGFQSLEERYSEHFTKKFDSLAKFLNEDVFKVPGHVLLEEDAVWDGLTQQGAKQSLLNVTAEMAKMREKYKTCLYKKTYLRGYLEKLKSICTYQEETIQKEVEVKEKAGLVEGEDRVGFFTSQGSILAAKLKTLGDLRTGLKRKTEHVQDHTVKRMKLELDRKKKVDAVRRNQIQCTQ